MSRAAKLTLAGTSLGAAGVIVFVHYAQKAEKAVSLRPHHQFIHQKFRTNRGIPGNACRRDPRYGAAAAKA